MASARKIVVTRMNPDERQRLDALAAHEGFEAGKPVPVSQMLILLVDRAYEKLNGAAPRRRKRQ